MDNNFLNSIDGVLEPGTLTHFFPNADTLDRQLAYVQKVLMDTRAIQEDMDVFENAVLVINGINPDVTKMEGCKPEHIWKAVGFIKDTKEEVEFSHEGLMYIKAICTSYGYYFYPPGIGLDEENELLPSILKLAESGPFPLEENYVGIQTAKYLKITQYLGE